MFQANTDNSGSSSSNSNNSGSNSSNSNNADTEDMSTDLFQQLSDRSDRMDADLQRIRDQVSLHLKKIDHCRNRLTRISFYPK